VRELMSSVAVFEAVILAKSMCMTKSCLKTRKKRNYGKQINIYSIGHERANVGYVTSL